jgi:hypothetical protein
MNRVSPALSISLQWVWRIPRRLKVFDQRSDNPLDSQAKWADETGAIPPPERANNLEILLTLK